MEFDKIKEEILLISECIEYIEENINKNTSIIIKELQNKHNLSRTPLDNKFKKICIYKDGTKDTASSYINGRKIQLGILEGDKLKESRLKFDIKNTLKLAEKMNCIQKYGFGTVEIDSENYTKYTYDLDYKKILDFTFKDSLLICPNLAQGYTFEEILKYNNSTIDPCDFEHFYEPQKYELYEIAYFKTNREWLIDMFMGDIKSKKIFLKYMNNYIYDDLSKYKTMIQKTKEYLGTHFYVISAGDVKYSEDDPILIIFNAILDVEKGMIQKASLKEIYLKYKDKGIFEIYQDCEYILCGLLLDGTIYIK